MNKIKVIGLILIIVFNIALLFIIAIPKFLDSDITSKKEKLSELNSKVNVLTKEVELLDMKVVSLKQKKETLQLDIAEKVGDKVYYILTLEVKQNRIIPEIDKMIKDDINKFTLELPVDNEFYDKVKVGDKITEKFRVGSFLISGTFSNWVIKVVKKTKKISK